MKHKQKKKTLSWWKPSKPGTYEVIILPRPKPLDKCRCDMQTLIRTGCRCGGK